MKKAVYVMLRMSDVVAMIATMMMLIISYIIAVIALLIGLIVMVPLVSIFVTIATGNSAYKTFIKTSCSYVSYVTKRFDNVAKKIGS